MLCAGSVEMMRTLSRTLESCTARLQLRVVFPTPPLPPTKIHLRLRCSMMLARVGSSGSTSGASSNSSASGPHPPAAAAAILPRRRRRRPPIGRRAASPRLPPRPIGPPPCPSALAGAARLLSNAALRRHQPAPPRRSRRAPRAAVGADKMAARGEEGEAPSPPPGPGGGVNVFANDGSFLELFKRKMEAEQQREREAAAAAEASGGSGPGPQRSADGAKRSGGALGFVGRRRGGNKLALKTGVVAKKQKTDEEVRGGAQGGGSRARLEGPEPIRGALRPPQGAWGCPRGLSACPGGWWGGSLGFGGGPRACGGGPRGCGGGPRGLGGSQGCAVAASGCPRSSGGAVGGAAPRWVLSSGAGSRRPPRDKGMGWDGACLRFGSSSWSLGTNGRTGTDRVGSSLKFGSFSYPWGTKGQIGMGLASNLGPFYVPQGQMDGLGWVQPQIWVFFMAFGDKRTDKDRRGWVQP
uniref:Telomerase RNA component interacting RNase n=1 Tax=Cairina moschata TaxID=8855 RepID=A0A8C3BGI2_CAIMO